MDLIRLSPRSLFPPGGRELYRQIALLTDMEEGSEVLVASCAAGLTLEFFVREFGVQGSGIDEDPVLIEEAEARIREAGLSDRLQLQCGSMESLPYRDGVFDVVVAELGLTASADPMKAIKELARVVRPGGRVALVHLVWKAPVDTERREVLSRHLGARPLMLVELKRGLREAGVKNLHSEAWSDESTAFRPHVKKPFPDFAELFSVPEKLGILRRAWARWGWRGVRTALAREREVHRLLTRERILGLDMLKGTRVADSAPEAASPPDSGPEVEAATRSGPPPEAGTDPPSESDDPPSEFDDPPSEPETAPPGVVEEDSATRDLPLFRGGRGDA